MPGFVTGHKRMDMLKLGDKTIDLWEYDEDTQREYIQTLAHLYKHAKVGDPQFIEICQGRAEGPAKRNELFSTCGEWAHFLLERMGYRGPILNRTLFDPDGDAQHGRIIRKGKQGKNLAYLFNRGRKEGAFVEYLLSRNKSKRPNTGDIVYISNSTVKRPAPNTEHVFYFDGIDRGPFEEELWATIDGGQGGRKTQHIAEGLKYFDQSTGRVYKWNQQYERKEGAGRRVIGWLNPVLLDFTESAHLRLPA
jgi:hypothetical protein